MAKPTKRQFFIGYMCVFVATQAYVISQTPMRQVPMAISMVNMLFVMVNMIGVCFARGGSVPWREKNEPPPKHSVLGFFRWIITNEKRQDR